jgi:seryl-tRNA synthetase
MCNDLTFFTNEEGARLLDRFKQTLENNTQYFDVLVGYATTVYELAKPIIENLKV